jgi:hypothetical protein
VEKKRRFMTTKEREKECNHKSGVVVTGGGGAFAGVVCLNIADPPLSLSLKKKKTTKQNNQIDESVSVTLRYVLYVQQSAVVPNRGTIHSVRRRASFLFHVKQHTQTRLVNFVVSLLLYTVVYSQKSRDSRPGGKAKKDFEYYRPRFSSVSIRPYM